MLIFENVIDLLEAEAFGLESESNSLSEAFSYSGDELYLKESIEKRNLLSEYRNAIDILKQFDSED